MLPVIRKSPAMETSKLLRSRRSSKNRKKRKQNEKAENPKRKRGQEFPQEVNLQQEETTKEVPKSKESESHNNTAERYHKHALHFYSKWKKAEERNVPVMEESTLTELPTVIGQGSFGVCTVARYGARLFVVKKQQAYASSRNEARITAKLFHPNVARLIGIVERESRCDIVTTYYNVNGKHINLSEISEEDTTINWANVLCGLCNGIKYIHETSKILHNDIKTNNVVLDGTCLAEAEAVLIDFGKATEQISPKVYDTPADTKKYKHLAPELGQKNGKQSKESDMYSLGFLIRTLKYKFPSFPQMFVNVYRSCMHTTPSLRPAVGDLCKQFAMEKKDKEGLE